MFGTATILATGKTGIINISRDSANSWVRSRTAVLSALLIISGAAALVSPRPASGQVAPSQDRIQPDMAAAAPGDAERPITRMDGASEAVVEIGSQRIGCRCPAGKTCSVTVSGTYHYDSRRPDPERKSKIRCR